MGSDFQRTILWVVLAAACFMLFDNWQVYNGKPSMFGSDTVAEQTASTNTTGASDDIANQTIVDAVAKGMIQTGRPVEVTSDLLKLRFDENGAVLTRAELCKERQEADWTEVGLIGKILGNKAPELKNIVLFDVSPTRAYVAQTGLIGGNFPNHKTIFKYSGTEEGTKVVDQKTVAVKRVKFTAQTGSVILEKTFEITDGQYGILVTHKVINNGNAEITPSVYYQLTRDGGKPEGESSLYYTYTGPAVYTEDTKFKKIAFSDIEVKPETIAREDNGWIAMIQHYFVSAWADAPGAKKADHEFYTRQLDKDLYSVGSIVRLGSVAPGSTTTTEALLYVGPQDQKRLEKVAKGLDLVVDYGWLTMLSKPIYNVLNYLHDMVGNWGWAIVLLTCLVKLILYPISAAGYKSMARMKEVSPRMKELQQQYGKDKQRLQVAIMELYKKEKINPVGGCLPIALQIPVFLALYWVLLASVELRGSEWILWVNDLAMPDSWLVLPAIMMVTMILQMFLNPSPMDPMQKKIMYIMPLVFGVMFFFFASGLVLYWLTNNVLSIAQQWYVNRQIAKERAQRIAAASAKEVIPTKGKTKK
jgi:YidC/Oxa1 family membrane protein insertase